MSNVNEHREAFIKEFSDTTRAAADSRREREEFTAAVSNFVAGYLKNSPIGAMDVAEGLSNVAQNIYRTFELTRIHAQGIAPDAPQAMTMGGRFA